MKIIIMIFIAAFLAAEVSAASRKNIEHLNSGVIVSSAENLPFSEAVRIGDTIYLSGLIGVMPNTLTLIPGGIEAEAKQTMSNIKQTLEAHDLSMNHVAKCTIMLADISDWPIFNNVYKTYFTAPYPARSAFAASGLAFGARVEVECIAIDGKRDEQEH